MALAAGITPFSHSLGRLRPPIPIFANECCSVGNPQSIEFGLWKKPFADQINVELVPAGDPAVVHDLDRYPYPLPDGRFDAMVV